MSTSIIIYIFFFFKYRYGEYKEYWECNNIPTKDGNGHKELRWQIKAQMLYKEEPAIVRFYFNLIYT